MIFKENLCGKMQRQGRFYPNVLLSSRLCGAATKAAGICEVCPGRELRSKVGWLLGLLPNSIRMEVEAVGLNTALNSVI